MFPDFFKSFREVLNFMIKEAEKQSQSNIMEGMISFRAVVNGIENGVTDRKIEKVLVSNERKAALRSHLSYIRAMSAQHSFPVEFVPSEHIDSIAIGTSHGGIITACSGRTIPMLSKEELCGKNFFVLLDGIEDPYNFGYALRSIYASGADGVVVGKRNWMSAAGVVCRASAGSSERMRIYICESAEEVGRIFSGSGFRIVCADIPNSRPVADADLSAPLLLAVGGEKRGLSKELLRQADEIVRLEYGRKFSCALSAASAASILSFFVLEKNRSGNITGCNKTGS